MSTNQNNIVKEKFFMGLALKQAQNSLGNTGTNPSVGCVIIKNGFLISIGSTSINGRPHAEENAIKFSKHTILNSEMYTTLEPCSHLRNNTSCTKLIIKKKLKKVHFSINDPDTRSFNKCLHQFNKSKISVKKGILDKLSKTFYKSYFKNKISDFPFVSAKIAISKDLYTKNIKKKWITNFYSRQRVHLIRSRHDCVLTSYKTILEDNPSLTCRIPGLEKRSPFRVIIDKNLKIPIHSNVLKTSKYNKTIIFFNKLNKQKIKLLKKMKVKLVHFPLSQHDNFDLYQILYKIKLLGFSRILIESGFELTTNFLKKGLIDEFHLFISGKKINKNGIKSFKKSMNSFLKNKSFVKNKINLFDDKFITYQLK